MLLKAKTIIKRMAVADLMVCFKPEEVLGLCKSCDQFGNNHSCPPHGFNVRSLLKDYAFVTLILTEIETTELIPLEEALNTLELSSRVLQQHQAKKGIDSVEPATALAMYVYDQVKAQVSARLLQFETLGKGVMGLPPGACTTCLVCRKSEGKACHQPQQRRNSLESLGFKVSDIYEHFFNRRLEWTSGKLPATFQTCSGVLSQSEFSEEILKDYFEGIEVVLTYSKSPNTIHNDIKI